MSNDAAAQKISNLGAMYWRKLGLVRFLSGFLDSPIAYDLNDQIKLTSQGACCQSETTMRLLAEIVIIAALISLGWNKPFKDQVAQANTTITSKLHGVGSKLQKHQDPSVRRY